MRRTLLLLAAAALLLAMVATPAAGAGVDNGGCPPDKSNWALETSFADAYADELAESLEAGFTLQDILAIEGFTTEADFIAALHIVWNSVDKNGDGAICMADFFGYEKKKPWYASIIDNVLPH